VALFSFILIRLLLLRYERGDIYREGSTFRSDPLGMRVFYESLEGTGRYQVSRGFVSLHREIAEKPGTLFFLGLSSYDIPTLTPQEIVDLDTYVKNGGRVIITLSPSSPGGRSSMRIKTRRRKKEERRGKNKEAEAKAEAKAKAETKENKDAKSKPPAIAEIDDAPLGPQTQQEKYEREELRKERDADLKRGPKLQQEKPVRKYKRSVAAIWGFGWDRHHAEEEKKSEPGKQTIRESIKSELRN